MSKVIIGKGGFGEVFYYTDRPSMVYKQSYGKCENLKHEYRMWKKAYNAFIKYTSTRKNTRKEMCILNPSKWEKIGNTCIFKMKRVFPLHSKYTWQAYIGNVDDPSMDKVVKHGSIVRGRYMGPDTLSKYFDVNDLAYQAGILIGIVHYCAHLDGLDTELVIGKTSSPTSKCRLFLIDFNQVNEWKDGDPKLVNRLSWPLIAEPYYPDSESPYHESFKQAYLKVAKSCGYEDLARQVLKTM